jgi:hypothetical protein
MLEAVKRIREKVFRNPYRSDCENKTGEFHPLVVDVEVQSRMKEVRSESARPIEEHCASLIVSVPCPTLRNGDLIQFRGRLEFLDVLGYTMVADGTRDL